MNLRRKVWLVLAVTVLVLLVALQLSAKAVVSGSFEKIENDFVARDMERARDGLRQRVADIEVKGTDWSMWDDMWKYMRAPTKEFADSNLSDISVQLLKLDLLLLFDSTGKCVHANSIDRVSGRPVPLDPLLVPALADAGVVGPNLVSPKVKSGIVLVGDRPILATCQPIVRSDGAGPQRGVIFMARWIDANETKFLSKLTHLDIHAVPFRPDSFAKELKGTSSETLFQQLNLGNGKVQRVANAATAFGYVRIDSIDGKPATLLVLKERRDVFAQGLLTVSVLRVAILLAVLALAIAGWLTLERTVMRRLAKLCSQVTDIGSGKTADNRVDEGSPDELGKLARAINGMIAAQEGSSRQVLKSTEAVRASEERLGLAIQGSKATIWDWNVVSGEIAWYGLVELLGCRTEEFPSNIEGFAELLHPDDVERFWSDAAAHLVDRETLSSEVRVMAENGRYLWFQIAGQAVFSEEGQAVRVVGSAIDIHERKTAEEQLSKFYLLVEKSQDFIAMADLEGRITYVNPAGKRMVGIADHVDVRTIAVPDFYPADLHPFVKDVMLAQTAKTGSWEGETRFVHMAGGDDIQMYEAVFAVTNPVSGLPLCFATVSRDISAAKKNAEDLAKARDEALASTRAKATFLANMSHEIRTPMNGVIGMTELLLDSPLSVEQRDYAGIIQTSADALLGIINDILDFTKIEAGKMEIDEVDFNLRTVLEEVSFLLAGRTHSKNLELICRIPPSLPEHLVGDPARVRQVVMNLLGNATKFTENGEILLEAAVLHDSVTDLKVRISVKDTGIGIPHERQADIFDSFTQADGSSSRRYCGTGLGLTISKQLAELMGGSIGLESVLGSGSTFWVDIPFRKQQVSGRPPSSNPLGGIRALIVDDNFTNRLILREYLKAWGCQSAEASGGQEALELLRASDDSEPFDVVLLDMQMPDMDGEDTARAIRKDARYANVGIVLLTSMGAMPSVLEGTKRGFDATLVKPVHQSQLFNSLAGIFDRRMVAMPPPSVASQEMPLKDLRILLVEDNAVNRKVATRILTRYGCELDVATNGVEALAALDKGPYDAVLMDCQMPEMDGYEATRELRRREVGTSKHQPVIAMTASALEGDRERCLASGMDDYVAKPVKPQELLQTILPWVTECGDAEMSGVSGVKMEVLDRGRLIEVCGDDQEFVFEVVLEFLNGVDGQLDAIRSAVKNRDCVELASAAHALKGASRTIGGVSAASVCEELEVCGRQGVEAGLDGIFERTEREFALLKEALASLVRPEVA